MVESPSEYSKRKKVKKNRKKIGSLEKEVLSTELKRSKYKKDFDKFVEDRQGKKWTKKVYIAVGLSVAGSVLGQLLGEAGALFLLLLFIPFLAGFFHMALIEYYRGNVNWTNYIWGALGAVWIGGIGLFVLWFFASTDTERLKSYIEERKNKK